MFNFFVVYWYKALTDAYIQEFKMLEEGKLIEDSSVMRIKDIDY